MAKKRNCRRTPEEIAIHDRAVKLRKLTDKQLVDTVDCAQARASEAFEDKTDKDKGAIKKLLDGLSRGECKGVKSATVYKITEYATEAGLI